MSLWTLSEPRRPLLGVLPGEGIGAEVTGIALQALAALDADVEVRHVGDGDIFDFCAETFAASGVVLAGPYGGRVVYDMRRRFDLFCKLSPVRPSPTLRGARDVDMCIVRENTGGVYQGQWSEERLPDGGRVAEHTFRYTEPDVRRILTAAARIAADRRSLLAVVTKPGGLPTISRLWLDCAEEIAAAEGVAFEALDADYAAYRVVQQPDALDVVVATNLFGDILSDVAAVLLGSRGLSFGGSFAADGAAIYQTNHGAAFDLAGTGRANPAGHLHALAMALRESFGLRRAAAALEAAIEETWAAGLRTADVAEPGARVVGMAEWGDHVVRVIGRRDVKLAQ